MSWTPTPLYAFVAERADTRGDAQALVTTTARLNYRDQHAAVRRAAKAMYALGVRRGLKAEYFIFTDPLIILAGAILLDRLRDLRFHRWTYPMAMTLFALHIAIGQAEPVKYAFMRRGPEPICEWNRHYLPLLPLPWCPIRS